MVEMEEDYDALLAADESDCIEDDPAYQLMLVRVPAPVTWRPVAAILVSRSEGLAGIEGKAKPWEARVTPLGLPSLVRAHGTQT